MVEEVMVSGSSRSSINSGRSGSCCNSSSSKYGSSCLIVSLIFWRSSDR